MNRIIWTAGLLMTLTSCGSLSPPSQVLTLRTGFSQDQLR